MEGREIVAFAAALIAAVLAYTKLIADKESKISDFRKDWINSLREARANRLSAGRAARPVCARRSSIHSG